MSDDDNEELGDQRTASCGEEDLDEGSQDFQHVEEGQQQISDNLVSRKIYNDVIDEEIDLEKPEEILPQNRQIENNHIDEVVQISSEEGEDVPSPRDNGDGDVFTDGDNKMAFGNNTQNLGGDLAGEEGVFDGYNPDDYNNLNVSTDIKNLFRYITNYLPQVTEIETILKPFIPEYIPTVGEVDAYLKIPRPDGQPEQLGMYQIDEPALNQTKKSEMDYIIKEFYMGDTSELEKVHSIENAHKNPKEIASWIQTINDHQAKKTAPTVIYSHKMPDIDELLEPWHQDFEKIINEVPLPASE